jgi:putative hydrolase of the HAD superfamily
VVPHLTRLELLGFFDPVITGDDVPKGRTKPHPDIYLEVLSILRLPPHEVLVLEDSPNGVTAAHAAGLRAVGVPNPVTALLEIGADLMLDSLGALPLDEILRRIEKSARADGGQRAVLGTVN